MTPPTDAQRVAAGNEEFWRQVREDDEYRLWMIERYKEMILICEWPAMKRYMESVLKELEAVK